jgi:hypothetical protein
LQVKLELAELPKLTLVGLIEQASPACETLAARVMVPVNPKIDLTIAVEEFDEPKSSVTKDGVMVTLKSRVQPEHALTLTVRVAE